MRSFLLRHKIVVLLAIIIFAGFYIRAWNIQQNPAGFFCDEASIGYNAYKIGTTGRDEYNILLPFFFRAFGEFKNPVFIYSAVPSILILGPTVFAVRFVSVLYGTATIAVLYLLVAHLFSKRTGLIAAVFLAVSPWHIHFSRVGFELISSIFYLLLFLYFLFKSFEKTKYYIPAIVCLFLTTFSYSVPKIYLPFILLFLLVLYFKDFVHLTRSKVFWITNIVAGLIIGFILILSSRDGSLMARWDQVRASDLGWKMFWEGYRNHFSIKFLFTKGDADFPGQFPFRHSVNGTGELYLFQIIFIVVGFFGGLLDSKQRKALFLFVLILIIYPIAASLTGINPQASRSILGVVPFTILTSYGFVYLFTMLHKRKILIKIGYVVFAIVFFFSWISFVHNLEAYPKKSSGFDGWQFGFREAVMEGKKLESSYDDILITHRFNQGNELLLFFNLTIHCNKCRIMNNPMVIDPTRKQLFILRSEDIEDAKKTYPEMEFSSIKWIYQPNGTLELYIGSFKHI